MSQGTDDQAGRYRKERCVAKAKGTGLQCQCWAVKGYNVCQMHGAGTRKRTETPPADGRLRKDPATAGLIAGLRTGRYLTRTKTRFGDALHDFAGAEDDLFCLKTMAARLWTALMTLDEVEGAFDLAQLVEMPDAVQMCACGELYRRADVARDLLQRVGAIRGVIHELLEVVRVKNKLDDKANATISETQMVALVVMIVSKLHEITQDSSVAREHIARTLTAWIDSGAKGQPSATA